MIALEECTSPEKSDDHEETTPLTGVPAQKLNAQPGNDVITKKQFFTQLVTSQQNQHYLAYSQTRLKPNRQSQCRPTMKHKIPLPQYQRIEIQGQGEKPVVTSKRLTWQ